MKCKTLLSYYSHDKAVCFLNPFPLPFPDSTFLQKRTCTVLPQISTHSLISAFLPHPLVLNRTLRSDDGDRNENFKKAIALISKTTIFARASRFLYISLPSLHDYYVKTPNFTFYRGSTQVKTKFPLSFWTWIIMVLRDLTLGGFIYIWQS